MKKIVIPFFVLVLGASVAAFVFSEGGQQSGNSQNMSAAEKSADLSAASVPVPNIRYFQERRTIGKWAQRWDQPNLPCYVYLISYGNIIGYYVTDGKPSSTQSYLTPEFRDEGIGNGGVRTHQLPDIDGTYGNNNPGIRFFTAEGTAVEWAGSGASYIYSDAPLPLNVPKLNGK